MTAQSISAPRYFWVNQGATFSEERKLGIIWAPQVNRLGKPLAHWTRVLEVQPGDIIFSYEDQNVVAVSVAVTAGTGVAGKPLTSGQWIEGPGYQAELAYEDLKHPISKAQLQSSGFFAKALAGHLIDKNGNFMVTYLNELSNQAGHHLAQLIGRAVQASASPGMRKNIPPSVLTQREQLVQARVGQGQFRKDVLALWNERCATTNIQHTRLLRASHIKSWSESENSERLDPHNGILLSAHIDAAFDCGLISFKDNGGLCVSKDLSVADQKLLGLDTLQRPTFTKEAKVYLAHHRAKFGY